MVFARGLTVPPPILPEDPAVPLAADDLRAFDEDVDMPLVLSLREALARPDGAPVKWSFCWWRSKRSRRAKHLVHSGHSKGFSLVCDRSWRLRCSSLANDLAHAPHTCGLGLSAFKAGMVGLSVSAVSDLTEAVVMAMTRAQCKSRSADS